jgi:hypothetical protein
MNPNSTSNQNPPGNALRDALLQQITPAQVAQAEARALTILAGQPAEESPRPHTESPKAARHSRKCKICNSPDREDIDQAYIHWVPLRRIVFEYADVTSEVSLYRHAIATGLFSRRRSRFQHALDRIIEQAGDTRPTADAVIRAIRASSMLNENGRWDEPTRRVIIEHHVVSPTLTPALTPALLDASVPRDILESTSNQEQGQRERTQSSPRTTHKEAL